MATTKKPVVKKTEFKNPMVAMVNGGFVFVYNGESHSVQAMKKEHDPIDICLVGETTANHGKVGKYIANCLNKKE